MKILKVRLLNINSLKGYFEIDFEKFLKDESLFAITGATGAGKSTILDVITCAMYGRTPRLQNPNELMSRHTGECLCEVEFEINGKVFRSSWSQKRARKNPKGNFQTAKMELTDLSTNKIIENKLRLVPKYIEELSGLDFERFKQSMMLAQGSFDAFLKAKENERSSLLEKITGTQIYKRISEEVYNTFSKKQRDIENEKLSLGNIEILAKEVLEEKIKVLESLKFQKKQEDKKEFELKDIFSWLKNIEKLQENSIKYDKEFKEISKEKEDKKEYFKKLELANKSLNVQPIYKEKSLLNQTIIQDKEKLQDFQKELEVLKVNIESKTSEFKLLKDKYYKEKISFEQNNEKLKNLRDLRSQKELTIEQKNELNFKLSKQKHILATLLSLNLEDILKDDNLINKEIEKQSQRIAQVKEQNQAIEKEYKLLEKKSLNANNEESIRVQIKSIEDLLSAIIEYEKVLEDAKKAKILLENINQDIDTQNKIDEEKTKLIKQIEETLSAKKAIKEREQLLKNYESDRAKLKEGQECFLCGSTSHPYITHTLKINIDETTKQIKEQEKLLSYETSQQKLSQINLAKLNSKLESTVLELKKQEEKIESFKKFFLNNNFTLEKDSKPRLDEQKQELQKKLQEIVNLRDEKEKLFFKKEKLQKEYNQIVQKDLQVKNTLKLQEEYINECEILKESIEKLEEKSKTILDIENLEEYERSINHSFKTIQDSYNNCEKELMQLNFKDESLEKQIEDLIVKQKTDKKSLEELKQSFEKALKENSFEKEEDLKKAFLSEEERKKLSQICKNIDEKYTQIRTLKIDTSNKLEEEKSLNKTEKKLKDINEELKISQEKIDELQRAVGSLEKELEINALNIKKHKDKIKELEKKKEEFKVWVKLNEMIGSSSGDKFAKFAQGITLDQLIFLANKHLQILSSRYELQRSVDSNKLLEIEIIDAFQGDEIRPVSTLSGGESFIVSLALALGLSALASQKISIDSLFLDEGFGTLDANSLELALNALNHLQSSRKMIGVISHVEALKERIPLQIKVLPRGDGTSFLSLG